jgi:hypothetical protein
MNGTEERRSGQKDHKFNYSPMHQIIDSINCVLWSPIVPLTVSSGTTLNFHSSILSKSCETMGHAFGSEVIDLPSGLPRAMATESDDHIEICSVPQRPELRACLFRVCIEIVQRFHESANEIPVLPHRIVFDDTQCYSGLSNHFYTWVQTNDCRGSLTAELPFQGTGLWVIR